jgi:4-amino-4-deoxy-L-arabinose transferase-like glycosyltransferase
VLTSDTPERPSDTFRYAVAIAGLAAIVVVAFFLDLGRPYFWEPDEGRYAEIVREMLLTGNWITPTLNFAPYYDKPPGFFWLVAAVFQMLGTSEWAARLPAALAAVLTIAATAVFGWRRIGPMAALGAGAVLATAIGFVALGRSVRMDTVLTLTVSGTLFYAYALWDAPGTAYEAGAKRPATWPLYVLSALGLLLKGPVAIALPVLVLAVLTLATGEYRRLLRFQPGLGALLAAAIASSWYVSAAVSAPDYLWVFLWRQNLGRFLGAGRGTGHTEAVWFFFWVLPLMFLPWTLFLPGALRRSLERLRSGDRVTLFLLAWFAVIFSFFTLSKAKLAPYILPVLPPLALLVAAHVVEALEAPEPARLRAFKMPGLVWVLGMLAGTIGVVVGVAVRYPSYGLRAAIALVLAVFPLGGLVALRRHHWRTVPALVLVGALTTHALFYRVGAPIVNEFSSFRTAAEVARALPTSAQVFAYKTRGHSFTFYAGRSLKRVRSPEAAAATLRGPEPAGLLTKAKHLAAIRRHLTAPASIWWQSASGRVLLSNLPPPDAVHHETVPPLAPEVNAQASPDC